MHLGGKSAQKSPLWGTLPASANHCRVPGDPSPKGLQKEHIKVPHRTLLQVKYDLMVGELCLSRFEQVSLSKSSPASV
jgi:hypothetical protein